MVQIGMNLKSCKVTIMKTGRSLRMIHQEWPKQKCYCLNESCFSWIYIESFKIAGIPFPRPAKDQQLQHLCAESREGKEWSPWLNQTSAFPIVFYHLRRNCTHKPSDPTTTTYQTQYDQRQRWMSQMSDPKGSVSHQMEGHTKNWKVCSSGKTKNCSLVVL